MDETITIEISSDGFYIAGENTSGVMYYCKDDNIVARKTKLIESVKDYVTNYWDGGANHV